MSHHNLDPLVPLCVSYLTQYARRDPLCHGNAPVRTRRAPDTHSYLYCAHSPFPPPLLHKTHHLLDRPPRVFASARIQHHTLLHQPRDARVRGADVRRRHRHGRCIDGADVRNRSVADREVKRK
jgi:hypothetical protein